MNSVIKLKINFNTPIFKAPTMKESTTIRTHLRDFCKQLICSNISSEYRDSSMAFDIVCKGKTYSIKECMPIYDLRLAEEDEISIHATVLEPKNIELTLKILYLQPKEITLKVNKTTLISDLLDYDSSLRFIRGDIELDLDQKIEDYDIMNKSKLHIIVDKVPCEEVQIWKIKKTGLVLEAGCMNIGCVAYRQRICINLGLGEFDVKSEISQENDRYCVCCQELLGKVSKIGFCHCKYSYTEILTHGDTREVCKNTKDYVEGIIPSTGEQFIVNLAPLY